VQLLQQQLLKASCSGVSATAQVLPGPVCRHIIKEVTAIFKTEPPLVELTPSASQHRVTVFGGSWCSHALSQLQALMQAVCCFELVDPVCARACHVLTGTGL
jgi:hypothetical protein